MLSVALFLTIAAPAVIRPVEIKFEPIEQGTHSSVKKGGVEVIRTAKELQDFVKNRRDPIRTPPPKFDAAKEQLIVVYGGQFSSGGYSVEVKGITQTKSGWAAHATVHKPAPGAMVTMALTTPYAVIKTARSTATVRVDFSRR